MNNETKKYLIVGALIGVLNALLATIYLADRPIGASTSYPFLASIIFDLQSSIYYKEIVGAGSWEAYFLLGGFCGALFMTLKNKSFKFELVPNLWGELKGKSKLKRVFFAFIGGFILIFGARLADGCTSGHTLSGSMELAASSLVFTFFVITSLIISSKVFYGVKK
jgi:uncharacterized membrane protein YedE/YeeE